jgi:hypothetical protein
LRVSEHVARGQVESLKETLNSISTELDPDNFLQHVVCIIAKQMGGQSVSVWNRDDDDSLTLAATFEGESASRPNAKNDVLNPRSTFVGGSFPVGDGLRAYRIARRGYRVLGLVADLR